MPAAFHLPGRAKPYSFRTAAVRVGIFTGICLTLVFLTWLIVANRVPALEGFALERNVAAAAAIAFLALIPVLRFRGAPGRLWASGVIAWGILSLSYRLLSLFFSGLPERYSAFQVFMVGAVIYTLVATLSWIAGVLWRMRASHSSQGSVSHSSATPSNHRMT